ncbi:hypothetical protein HG531_010919 [Fusarium graminearum]|nr:hypothetical protein HG531_010919 [Fusarium graminearum]
MLDYKRYTGERIIDIDFVDRDPSLALPEVSDSPEDQDNRESKVRDEETLDGAHTTGSWRGNNGNIELSDKDENDQSKTKVRASDTKGGLERNLVQSVTLSGPSLTETNVGNADGTPDLSSLGVKVDKGDETHEDVDEDGDEGTATTVNVSEHLGGISVLSHGSQGTGTTVNTRHTKRQNRHENDDVHEVVETVKTSILANEDKGRCLGVGVSGNVESLISGLDKKTNEGKAENVEESNTPENLLDGTGEGLGRVLRLGSGETNQLKSLEAVLESTGVLVPKPTTPVLVVAAVVGTTTTNQDNRNEHEGDGSSKLQAGRPKLFLSITDTTKDVDDDNGNEEDGNEDSG